MRARHWASGALLSGAILSPVLAGMAAMVEGCGTTPPIAALDSGLLETGADQTSPPVDAGADVHAKVDAGKDAETTDSEIADGPAEACDVDADLLTIMVSDASLGTSSVGLCLACAKASCNPELVTCNGDCACIDALVGVIGCVAGGASFLSCAALAASEPNAETLGLCIYSACPVACGITAGTREGGADGAPDAPHDAPDDAG